LNREGAAGNGLASMIGKEKIMGKTKIFSINALNRNHG
jgi:hypothetical protein